MSVVSPPPVRVRADQQRLRGGALGLLDIAGSTMANIGPAMSFYFSFGFLATASGLASPLTIVAAGVAVALLGNTLAQFSRAHPSAGSFVTFVGTTFGGASAVATALLAALGYIIGISAVIAVSGGFLATTLEYYAGWSPAWVVWTLVLTAASAALIVRGIVLSTKVAGFFFAVELVMLLVVSVAAIVKHGGHLSAAPFLPSHIRGGMSGLAEGFPLAVYLFIGWENSAALAEESENPRRDVGRAVFSSIAVMSLSYVLFAYATVTGFGYDVHKVGAADVPFMVVARGTLGVLAFLAYIAGLTSTVGSLIAGANSQTRLLFNAGRERLLPAFLGYVHPTRRTPTNAILTFIAAALVIIGGWGLGHLVGHHGRMDATAFFAEASSMGSILILLVYLAANIALPFYYRRYRPTEFRAVRHVVLPLLGAVAIVVPLYYLVKPGQPAPYSWFPYVSLALLVASVAYALVLTRRDPTLGERVGAVVADGYEE
ncbi:amino acid permease-associated region [Catenulispora acidiphila DSM 44928]|uniref:Amino acid permease-associated region n=1 Tax=Catenulispora acidiphila (strain DSM 44928 / JCM 14897 / NBRC 102108 / NRRL B-24433 / ID139908) TaxID=479433 RepID=C7Q7K9_CATAD|nr:APC family permease [Catenulispora acidiphila]ACU72202.1 amino acid permease-associated region [Catenulispora acidiphila DSM 44928]